MKILSLIMAIAIACLVIYAQSCNGRGPSAGVAGMLALLLAGVLALYWNSLGGRAKNALNCSQQKGI
jgi:hypothetical protein